MVKVAILIFLAVAALSDAAPGSIRSLPGAIKGKLQNPEQLKADLKRWANFACDLKERMASTPLDKKTKIAMPFVKAACGVTRFVGKMATNGKAAAGGLFARGQRTLGGLKERATGLVDRVRNREMIEPDTSGWIVEPIEEVPATTPQPWTDTEQPPTTAPAGASAIN